MIKLVAIDMDGTLLDSNKKIPRENIEAIQKVARTGVKIVLCTGRPKSGIIPYFEQLGLTDEEYIIMNNGCTVYNTKSWQLLDYAQISNKELDALNQSIETHSQVFLTLTSEESYYVVGNQVPDLVEYDAGLVFDTAKAISLSDLKLNSEIIFQAMFMAESNYLDSYQKDQERILGEKFSVVRSQSYIFEAMPKGNTKATALRKLSEKLGYSFDVVMAIGDAANDLEMLKFSGLSVAMGNASDEIKSHCQYVTDTNDQAGVAKAIYDYIL